ncbi:hypothetical protein Mag101_03225 [Microbulbifer agarilyticus]|uniref:non-specific serine/threonine protein kinase n=1 Tax=Microbulbifer agarilyticus TaxID=260552 RepID=A0A1Q2M266_9GAMM|nr:serine/threonine-protein kinase [Microbulbifer agarilyticus]AQQ66760.1 hypothetical protein Mag101_03225 [Microbulbifer agarilyticus]
MDIADPDVVQKSNATDAREETPQLGSDRYRVLSTLGAGGMGVVYLAEDLKLHRKVAVKKLRDDIASQNARERIQQEARLLAQLNHPNIVALHDVLEETAGSDTSVALVMEYIEGTTLRAWMRERSPSLQQKLSLLMQICLGLQQAHDLGIIHRDLKADNILIAENAKGEPVAKITDFGIAKSQQLDEKTLTAENQLAGTITAMSPEQILGKTLTARSDLFSLGAIAFELLCGSRPFEKHEAGALAMANRITSEPHIPPQQAWRNIPDPLAVLLDKLLAKEPAQRPESAQIVYQGFALLHKQGMEAEAEDFTATLTDLFTQQKVKSRRRWQRITTGVAATLVLGTGSYWGWKEITRLEPQYIAVMPVEINGEIRGEENAKALTKTMVRQALMNSISHLKGSALLRFKPDNSSERKNNFNELVNLGATHAISAQLLCEASNCQVNIELIDPNSVTLTNQISFSSPLSLIQESEFKISSVTASLFDEKYRNKKYASLQMNPENYNTYLAIASKANQDSTTKFDLELLEKLLETHSQNTSLYKLHTQISFDLFTRTGKKEFLIEGLQQLRKAKQRKVPQEIILELEFRLRSQLDQSADIDGLAQKMKELNFPSSSLLTQYAKFLQSQGNYEDSQKYLDEAIKIHPSSESYYISAINLYLTGDYEKAIRKLYLAIEKNQKSIKPLSLLSGILIEKGEYIESEKIIKSIPKTDLDWYLQTNLGTAFLLQKRYEEALQEYRNALSKSPNNITIIGNIAETLLLLNKKSEAKNYFEQLKKLTANKNSPENRSYYAQAIAYLGSPGEAIEIIHQLNSNYPENSDVKYISSQVYILGGEYNSAGYQIKQLLNQGMSKDWFLLPVYKDFCEKAAAPGAAGTAICSQINLEL